MAITRDAHPFRTIACGIAASALAAWLGGDAPGQESRPVTPTAVSADPTEPTRRAAYLEERLGRIYAVDERLDRALSERAGRLGIDGGARIAFEEARLGITRDREGRPALSSGDPLHPLEAHLAAIGGPRGVVAEALARIAARRALATALIIAERPPPTPEAIRAAFERAHGPGGVRRVYLEIAVSTDPRTRRRYPEVEALLDPARAREEARSAAAACARAVQGGADIAAAARAEGGEPSTLAAAIARLGPAGAAATSAEAGAMLVLEGPTTSAVVVIDERMSPARLDIVKLALAPRPGEEHTALRARAEEARRALAEAADPAFIPLERSDDPVDRRTGGVAQIMVGAAETSATSHGARAGPEASPVPEALLPALARARVGETTPVVPWRKGYAAARVLARVPLPGTSRVLGRAALFPSDLDAARARLLAPRIDALAAARARSLLARIVAGERMDTLATKESDDPRAGETGGFSPPGAGLPASIAEAALALAPAGPPALLRSPQGLHIVRCEEERRTRLIDVESRLRESLRASVPGDEEVARYLRDLAR